ncbi:hypothetical protein P3S20_21120, partial [Enterobacter hormaechei]|uniref:hypothetical protein n=1 Tax=Enterobacter hormaechei TaxID=158836 RepID=UPI0023E41ECB
GCNPTSSKFIHTWLRFGEIMRGSLSASLARFIGPEGEFKVNISVSNPDRLFFTDKVRNSVFWR